GASHKGSAALRGCQLKAAIELVDVVLPQKPVGRFHRVDPPAAVAPAAAVPARCRSCARCAPAPAANRPGSSAPPTRAELALLASGDGDRLCLPPWA